MSLPEQRPDFVLVSDFDGTIAVNGLIGGDEFAAAGRLRDAGIPLVVVTGRTCLALQDLDGLNRLSDEVIFSSGAGRLTADGGPEEIHWLSASEVIRIADILDNFNEDYCILPRIPDSGAFRWVRRRKHNPDFDTRLEMYASICGPMKPGSAKEYFPDGALQFLILRPVGEPVNPEMKEALSPWSVFTCTSPFNRSSSWMEIFPAGVNKGRAVCDWCTERGIPSSNVMAVGNDYNDLPMLEWAGHPLVVENAPEAMKNVPGIVVVPPAGKGGFPAAVEELLSLI